MKSRYIFFLCALLTVAISAGADTPTITSLLDTDMMAEILGDGWAADQTMLLESEDDVAKLSGDEKQMGEMLFRMMKPHGVIAAGEFSFSRTEPPLNNLTVKVFKFSSPENANAFRKLKYESEKSGPLYKKSETSSTVVYDSLEMKKRIVFEGIFWVTCGHIQDNDQHLKILETCVKLDGLQPESKPEK